MRVQLQLCLFVMDSVTPPVPPLSGGAYSDALRKNSPPLTRGGREGFRFSFPDRTFSRHRYLPDSIARKRPEGSTHDVALGHGVWESSAIPTKMRRWL
jgi:hypothetical protein